MLGNVNIFVPEQEVLYCNGFANKNGKVHDKPVIATIEGKAAFNTSRWIINFVFNGEKFRFSVYFYEIVPIINN